MLSSEAPTCPHCGFINTQRLAAPVPAPMPLMPPADPDETQVAAPIHDVIPMAPMSAPIAPPAPVAAPVYRPPVQQPAPVPELIPVDAAKVRAVRDAQRRWAWRVMTPTEGLVLGISIVAVVLVAIWVLGIFVKR